MKRIQARAAWRRLLAGAGLLATAATLTAPAAAQGLDLPPGCSEAAPVTCRYQPARQYTPGQIDLLMVDPARANHPIPFRVRYPIGATGPLPVVIWSHGGSTTQVIGQTPQGWPITQGQTSSERRGLSFSSAGYVVIHIGRLPVLDTLLTTAQIDACDRVGIRLGALIDGDPVTSPREACRQWTGWHLYGPQNVAFVAARLALVQAALPANFRGTLDSRRIVIGGWSGGTESVMNIAGAPQSWAPVFPHATGVSQPSVNVPGAIAFFADAPRRPSYINTHSSGFSDAALAQIDGRPFLSNSGKNDIGPDVAPSVARAMPWLSAQPGGKLLAWDRSGLANHSTVNLGHNSGGVEEGCRADLGQAPLCMWYEDLGIAYVDAAAKRRPEALRWLESDAVKVLTGRSIELHRR